MAPRRSIQPDKTTSGKEGQWRGNGHFASWVRRRIMPQQGWAESARDASRMAEEDYEKLKGLHGL